MATRRTRREGRDQQRHEALAHKLDQVDALRRQMLADAAALPPARCVQAAAARGYAARLNAILEDGGQR